MGFLEQISRDFRNICGDHRDDFKDDLIVLMKKYNVHLVADNSVS